MEAKAFASLDADDAEQRAHAIGKGLHRSRPSPLYVYHVAHGQTDELGCYLAENKFTIRDLRDTILHGLGFDPDNFSYSFRGLNNRLIGTMDEARVVREILV